MNELVGNDELRRIYAGRPDMAAWLDEREAAILGIDRPVQSAPEPPRGMDPALYGAMLNAGATSPAPPAPSISMAPPVRAQLPPPPGAAPPPSLPTPQAIAPAPVSAPVPTPAAIQPLPQAAPVTSQVSPTPAVAAAANINNNVTIPTPTFNPAQGRPSLPTFQAQALSPNLGAYAPAPVMPGYGMPRLGSPFKPAAPPGLPTFAAFGGGGSPSVSPQPYGQPEPDMGQNIMMRRPNLFNLYQ